MPRSQRAKETKPTLAAAVAPPAPAAPLPDWFPAWAREMADLYFSGTTCVFILHGNVHDLVCSRAEGAEHYTHIVEFLATQLFGSWDVVLHYDLALGLRPQAGSDAARHQEMIHRVAPRLGEPPTWPREPEKALLLLDRYIERCLIGDEPPSPRSLAFIFDYAQYLVPAGDIESVARALGASLVRFLSWAQNPYLRRINVAFTLIADRLGEVNDRLVQNPHVATIEVPLPDREGRRRFVEWTTRQGPPETAARLTKVTPEELAEAAGGLSLVNLNGLLAHARRTGVPLEPSGFRRLKKGLIERQCRGLLEFIEPGITLDFVVGLAAAKRRLTEDAALLTQGRLDAAPMGYLICGPVGTGKTFLAECYAGSVGIPCVKLRNFRSKYVGETESNLEHVLTVLRSLGPIVVIIDEADAALGDRQSEGDSGTSGRVFSMIASQMGDTRYRGRIIWMLLTCRPDLLPIDIKRQGRAEVHIPLFYPSDSEEIATMFLVMAKKNKVALERADLPPLDSKQELSGADVESIVLAAKRQALALGETRVTKDILGGALREFIPSAQGLEKELQELAAVLECTQLEFLPPHLREKVARPDGRARIQERMVAIRQLVED